MSSASNKSIVSVITGTGALAATKTPSTAGGRRSAAAAAVTSGMKKENRPKVGGRGKK